MHLTTEYITLDHVYHYIVFSDNVLACAVVNSTISSAKDPGKIVFHVVTVQRDLSRLWSLDMKGKVVGAVETCLEGEASFYSMDTFINFSDAWVAQKFDPKACTWAFEMNLFDLKEWRGQDLTSVYLQYLDLGVKRRLWKAGSLPIGWLTFLGANGEEMECGWVRSRIRSQRHRTSSGYDGIMKRWLDIGIDKYKRYWNIHVAYHHPYLQLCNIHD